jgi:hypothetical protein
MTRTPPPTPPPTPNGLRRLGVALALLALGLVPGCGPGVGDVGGKVYLKGKEVTSGFVTLIGRNGVPHSSEIAADGSYRVTRVPAGEAKVVVSSPAPDPAKATRPPPKREGAEVRNDSVPTLTEAQKKTWREIPAHYGDVTRSPLRCTVAPGPNAHDIKMD